MEVGILLKLGFGIGLNWYLYNRGFWDFMLPKKLKKHKEDGE